MKKYDLHSHTHYSKCSINNIAKVLRRAKKMGFDGIAITDHNQIKGAQEAKKLNNDPDFEVIVGEEVKTDRCEILVYYVKERIKPGKYEDVMREIRRQGAVCSIAHPFTGGNRKPIDSEFLAKAGADLLPDAIETFNGRIVFVKANKKAARLARKLELAETGGSDGHFLSEIGAGYTLFEGNLKTAIRGKKTKSGGKKRWPFFHRFLTFFVMFFKKIMKRVFDR